MRKALHTDSGAMIRNIIFPWPTFRTSQHHFFGNSAFPKDRKSAFQILLNMCPLAWLQKAHYADAPMLPSSKTTVSLENVLARRNTRRENIEWGAWQWKTQRKRPEIPKYGEAIPNGFWNNRWVKDVIVGLNLKVGRWSPLSLSRRFRGPWTSCTVSRRAADTSWAADTSCRNE